MTGTNFPFPRGFFSILQSGKLSIQEEGTYSILGKGKEKTLSSWLQWKISEKMHARG